MNLTEKNIYRFDKYIMFLTRKLRRNTLSMDEADFLQFGREEVIRALKSYDIEKSKFDSEAFVKQRLRWRFFSLFESSIGRTSLIGKTALRKNKRESLSFQSAEEKADTFSDIICGKFENVNNFEDSIYFKQVLSRLSKNFTFNKNWNAYKKCFDEIYHLNRTGKYLSEEYNEIYNKMKNSLHEVRRVVRKKINQLA